MIVETYNLRRQFGRHEALRALNLSVPEGSVFALIGSNGAGKTTTIKILMNILRPSGGSATLLGVDSRHLSHVELAQIGYVSENQEMAGQLTVGQQLDYVRPFYATWDRQLEESILAQLRLPLNRKICDLSHGMRLKLALACALPFRPRLLILDEPFSGLDPLVRDEFMDQLLRHSAARTVLISSHELADIEGVISHVAFLDEGRLLFQLPLRDLTARTRQVRVTLDRPAVPPSAPPREWLQITAAGNEITFVDTAFNHDHSVRDVASHVEGVQQVEVTPLTLRSIFTTVARAAQASQPDDVAHPQ